MVAVAGRVVGDVPGASPDDRIVDAIILKDHQVANVTALPPLNAHVGATAGPPSGQFGTRTSPERPRFRAAFLEPGAEVICATYV